MLDTLPIAAPALPLDEAGKYVAAAYIVFVVLILVYVAIMAAKLQRIERELRELAGFAEQRKASQGPPDRAEAPSRNPEVEAVAEELHR
jgi:CcmD family protein